MTIDHFLVLDLEDIRAIRAECRKCHASISMRLTKVLRVPSECPGCKEDWQTKGPAFPSQVATKAMEALQAWHEMQQADKTGFALRFELPEPRGPKPSP